jgi:hypothetical protein
MARSPIAAKGKALREAQEAKGHVTNIVLIGALFSAQLSLGGWSLSPLAAQVSFR